MMLSSPLMLKDDRFKKFSKSQNWGYWIGGTFCFMALLALSLGLTPLILAAREKLKVVQLPGETMMNIRIPGTYMGVTVTKDMDQRDGQGSLPADRQGYGK